jgi:Serine carboxypeptidase S28
VTPKPYDLVQKWKFDELVATNVTRILFTNGLRDGWSVGAIKESLSESLPVINFPNGAHHSDLSGRGPSDDDSEDIKQGFRQIIDILGKWMNDVRDEKTDLDRRH